MKSILILTLILFLASSFGRHSAARWLILCDRPLERFVFSTAIGLGVIAYGVFALGCLGLLAMAPITILLIVLGLIAIPGFRDNAEDIANYCKELSQKFRGGFFIRSENLFGGFSALFAFACIGIAVLACFSPPNSNAWDALSYHLADPKIYLAAHRIIPLPTQHHSNFPFLMEMLFVLGLLYDSYALANLFHLTMTLLLSFGLFSFSRRFLSDRAGYISITVLLSAPLVLWESTVAYIDLGLSLYIFLAIYSAVAFVEARRMSSISTLSSWIWLAGISMGFALGVKYLALLPFGFVGFFLVASKAPGKLIFRYALIALAIGSPWYLKNIVWMHNPVYPFAYQAFPHSKYWSEDRAAPYAEEQKSFGHEHSLSAAPQSALNLMMTPWNITTQYWRGGTAKQPNLFTNDKNFTFTSLIGAVGFATLFALVFIKPLPRVIRYLSLFAGLNLVSWFFVSQHIRYLIPLVPLLALISGFVIDFWLSNVGSPRKKIAGFFGIGVVGLQALQLAYGILFLPTSGRGAVEALSSGLAPTALSMSEVMSEFSEQGHERHLQNSSLTYPAVKWINENSALGDGVVLIEDVHGFYLDRHYLWGNEGHSSYIPYEAFQNGGDLVKWMSQQKIRYVLVNMKFAEENVDSSRLSDDLLDTQSLLQTWYERSPKRWKTLYGDALKRNLMSVVFVSRGVAVLKMDNTSP